MTSLLVGKIKIDTRLTDIATIPVFRLDCPVKLFATPVFEAWVR